MTYQVTSADHALLNSQLGREFLMKAMTSSMKAQGPLKHMLEARLLALQANSALEEQESICLSKEDLINLSFFFKVNEDGSTVVVFDDVETREPAGLSDFQLRARATLTAAMHGELCKCQNCGNIEYEDDLNPIADYTMRVAVGEAKPAGECTVCGCLSHRIYIDPYFEVEIPNGSVTIGHTFRWSDALAHFKMSESLFSAGARLPGVISAYAQDLYHAHMLREDDFINVTHKNSPFKFLRTPGVFPAGQLKAYRVEFKTQFPEPELLAQRHNLETYDGWMAACKEILLAMPKHVGIIEGGYIHTLDNGDLVCSYIQDVKDDLISKGTISKENLSECDRSAWDDDLKAWDSSTPELCRAAIVNPRFGNARIV